MRPVSSDEGVQAAAEYFTSQSRLFTGSCTALRKAIETKQPVAVLRQRLVECRARYKHLESFLEYFFRSSSTIYNRPPKFEAEDGSMEYQSPVGLQVIESLLYDKRTDWKTLYEQAKAVESSAADLPALLYGFKADDRQVLESLRIELIRVMALDITGYEAPLLKTGIQESYEAMVALDIQLTPYLHRGEVRSDSLRWYLDRVLDRLSGGRKGVSGFDTKWASDFDAFDRMAFLCEAILPLQRQLGSFIRERKLELNTNKVLNYAADDLFSPDALIPENFPGGRAARGTGGERVGEDGRRAAGQQAPELADQVSLMKQGRALFFDASLSGNGQKSCASCHNPTLGFTDGQRVSIGFDGHQPLSRNTPTLLYSGYQFNLFWDGRVHSLDEQIQTVLHDEHEMKADTAELSRRGGAEQIAAALAAYVRSLHPMNSPFDRYMRGAVRLSANEINGANLFMGKAQCATCHFIPLFNGLIPPDYALTEFEVLGTTATDEFGTGETKSASRPTMKRSQVGHVGQGGQARQGGQVGSLLKLSPDQGRYQQYPFPFFKGAFKTPTVRNAAVTGPYMHNGAFHSLESVLEFYNKGGGAGLGLEVPDQTLSAEALHLTPDEVKDIILFIHTLTDTLNS